MSGRSASDVSPSRSRNSSVVANVTAPVVGIGAGLGDQAARQQRPHHRVDVDAAHRADAGPGHRLPVGHHRQRLQRGAGQLGPRPVEQQPFHVRRELRPGVHPPAAARLAQIDAAVAGGQLLGHQPQLGRHPVGRLLGRRGQLLDRSPGCPPPAAAPRAPRRVRRPPSSGASRRRYPDRGPVVDVGVGLIGTSVEIVGRLSSVILVFFHRQVFVGRPFAGPRNLEHTKRFWLLKCYRPGPVQLEQRQEPADDLDRRLTVGHQVARTTPTARSRGLPAATSGLLTCSGTDTTAWCRCSVATVGTGRGVNAAAAICAKVVGVDTDHHLGQQLLRTAPPAPPPAGSCAAPRPRVRRTSPPHA